MLANNIIFLRKKHKALYDLMQNEVISDNQLKVARDGASLTIEKDGVVYKVNSEYSPGYESQIIYDNLVNQNEPVDKVLFIGVGLGHLIKNFSENNRNCDIYIFEPNVEIFKECLDYCELPERNIKGMCVGKNFAEISKFLSRMVSVDNKKILVVEIPSYKNFYGDFLNEFYEKFKVAVRSQRSSIHTNYAFQKKWIVNGLSNFFTTLKTPNILKDMKDVFCDKPVIIAASGPSLTDELENLKKIKEEGLAYIFAVGSSINILIKNGVFPDVTLSYDPGNTQHLNHDILRENKIDDLPLIFGSSVGNKVVKLYPGPKLHVLTNQDKASEFYLSDYKELMISDAPSIAAIALQILTKLKASPVIFVGQNLAFRDKKWYADGQRKGYEKLNEDKRKANDILLVDDVYGNKVNTTNNLISFKTALEVLIKANPEIEYINTTKFGANIKGTKFINLDELFDEKLNNCIVDPSWYDKNSESTYDFEVIKGKNKIMRDDFLAFGKMLGAVEEKIAEIENTLHINNLKQLGMTYKNLDNTYNLLAENNYYKYFIAPLNRVHYQKLSMDIRLAKQSNSTRERANMIIEAYKRYINICKAETIKLNPHMEKFFVLVDRLADESHKES